MGETRTGRGSGGRQFATVMTLGLALLNSACTTASVLDVPAGPGRSGLEATRSLQPPRTDPRREGLFERMGRPAPTEVTLSTGTSLASAGPLYSEDAGEAVTLNLVDVPIRTAANTILTEILGASFVIGDDVSGTITLQTSRPVSRQALVDSFQSVLASRGLSITQAGGIYRIGAATDPVETGSLRFADGRGVQVGTAARIVPLRSISAVEMKSILAPIAPNGVLRADATRNVLVLSGTAEQIRTMQETIALFDVDWMRGRSAAIFPLQSDGDPAAITRQLEVLFGTDGGQDEDPVRFIASRELNSILVISTNPRHLDRVRDYIAKFEFVAAANTPRNFVYKVENRPAKELATIVQGMIASRQPNGVAVGLSSIRSSVGIADETASGQAALAGATAVETSASDMGAMSSSSERMTVVADEPNNSLIVVATRAQYDRLLPILIASDRMANQVLIEAVIAEVTLNDQLRFGLRWFFENSGGKGKGVLSDAANGAIAAVAPGFSYFFADVNFQVVLNALSSITNVKVISSPTLTVLDNRTARLQIGDQVPVVTQTATATSTSIDAPIVNKVEMKDTGVILSVTPRVNSNGHVLLNIEQEVSDVVRTTTSGIDSPTIRQRKVATTVVVDDGQSIALGGLVQETREKGDGKVPILGDVPVLGAAFRDRTDVKKRTELVIFIRPRVMRNGSEAEAVTREFRDGLARLGLDADHDSTFQRIAR